jgi:predicted metalloprotease
MRWRDARRSTNIEDRRGRRPGKIALGGGLSTIIILLVSMYFGIDPTPLLEGVQQVSVEQPAAIDPRQDELADMVSVVMGDTETVWNAVFAAQGLDYREPTLVLFTGATQSACGMGQAAMGPFYCPADQKAYIDLSFYDDLRRRHGAPGDFAQAYVIAHEVGHHVQNLLGISNQVYRQRQQLSQVEGNRLSVMQELQADCFAGVWANRADRARNLIEAGDIEEALNAASRIGDDALQRQSRGTVVPESFTHGTSAQRQRWFRRGFESGDPEACDTFNAASL